MVVQMAARAEAFFLPGMIVPFYKDDYFSLFWYMGLYLERIERIPSLPWSS